MKQQRRLELSGIQVGITGEYLVAAELLAAARKLAIRLYWMVRTNTGYPGVVRVESSSRVPLVVRHCG
jgi:hypothetical protein